MRFAGEHLAEIPFPEIAMDVARAKANQLANIEKRSGKPLAELVSLVRASGLTKHSEVIAHLKQTLGLGHGDANAIALYANSFGIAPAGDSSPHAAVDGLYTGPKAALRSIHDAVMAKLSGFGAIEVAPKKGYLSLRRAKQFACITPATKTRLDIGIILKGVKGTERLVAQPARAMFPFKVGLESVGEVDRELVGWLRRAFDAAK
jgi:Domain of unknown function (DUF4287)/Domain of unknown function (DUF5655)